MSSFGYSDSETCICCPCLTASQVLLFITVPFFGFNLYKLGLGVDYDSNCDSDFNVSQVNSRFGNNYCFILLFRVGSWHEFLSRNFDPYKELHGKQHHNLRTLVWLLNSW